MRRSYHRDTEAKRRLGIFNVKDTKGNRSTMHPHRYSPALAKTGLERGTQIGLCVARAPRPPHSPSFLTSPSADRRSEVRVRTCATRRSFRNKSSKEMAFPHPQARKNHYRKKDKPSSGCIVWKFFKRTINVAEYRNGKDDVNPAKNRTLGALVHVPPRFMTLEPSSVASWAFQYRTAWRTRRSIAASRTSWPRGRRCGQPARPRGAAEEHRNKCATRQHPSR